MNFKKRNIKLFILSGYARSGKDTVSKLIQAYYKDKKVINISYGHYIKDYAKRVSDWDGSEDTKPRELLQQLGIELIKSQIDDKLFIRRILEDIKVFSYFYDIIIIDDARLIDEIESIKNIYPNSINIRIIRENYDNGLSKQQKEHLTETSLDDYNKFDYIIYNTSYDILNLEVKKILEEVENAKNSSN